MQAVTTIGLDIAKSVFQVHGIDAEGQVIIRRQLRRRYVLAFFEKLAPCLVGIEACAAWHHWSRQPLQRDILVATRDSLVAGIIASNCSGVPRVAHHSDGQTGS